MIARTSFFELLLYKSIYYVKNQIIYCSFLLLNQVFSQINLSNGLYICYPLDGNSTDFSGNLNHATNHGATPTTDRFGNSNMAMDFNGISDYLSIDNALPDAAKFSISVWVLHTKISSPSCILSDADDVPYNDVIFNLSDDGVGIDANKPGGLLTRFDADPLGNYSPIIVGQQLNNFWHHLVWVCDSSSQQVYIDTFLMASVNIAGTNIGYHNVNPSIGRMGDGISNGPMFYFQYFMGKMDEFKFYTRALDFQEVKALYTNPSVCSYVQSAAELNNGYTMQIFPCPFISSFTLKSDKVLKDAIFVIYDLFGKEVKRVTVNGTETTIDRGNLSSGIYTYKISEKENLLSVGKLIAE